MKKFLALALIMCMISCTTVAFADVGSNDEDLSKGNKSDIIYDMDDFAEYMQSNIGKEDASILVEEYFKNIRLKDEGNSNNANVDKSIGIKQGTKALKEVKLDDTQSITFYSNGIFTIDELTVGEETIVDVVPDTFVTTATATTRSGSYTATSYSDAGVKLASVSVSCTFMYDGDQVAVVTEPDSTYSVNTSLYTAGEHGTIVYPELGVFNYPQAYSEGYVEAHYKYGSYGFHLSATLACSHTGLFTKYSDIYDL